MPTVFAVTVVFGFCHAGLVNAWLYVTKLFGAYVSLPVLS
jgi:hypothetical protein